MSTVVDDTNPNIQWSGSSWRNGDDPMLSRYFNSTFRHSVYNGEYVSLSWRGKDIAVYGARRENHGIYSVSLDNGESQYFSGYASGSGQYQTALFATTGLAEGEHTIKVVNENRRNAEQYPNYVYLDIDFFALTGELIEGAAAGGGSSSSSFSASSTSAAATSSSAESSSSESASSSSASVISNSSDQPASASDSASDLPSSSSATDGMSTMTSTEVSQVGLTTGQYTESITTQSVTATEGVEQPNTTGTPNLPPASTSSGEIPGAESNAETGSSSNSKTTVAVSVSVITVAVVVILTVLGLYLHKKRKAKREQEELQQAENLMSQQSWTY